MRKGENQHCISVVVSRLPPLGVSPRKTLFYLRFVIIILYSLLFSCLLLVFVLL